MRKQIFFGILSLLILSLNVKAEVEGTEYEMPPPNPEGTELPPDFDDEEVTLPDESDVLVLTEANFDETIKNNKYVMVEFYARNFFSLNSKQTFY